MKETVAADFKDFLANTSDICVIIKREENKYNCNTVCSFEEEPRPTVSHYLFTPFSAAPLYLNWWTDFEFYKKYMFLGQMK